MAAGLEYQDHIRLKDRTFADYEGFFISSTDATLLLEGDQGKTSIQVTEIEKLWIRGNASKSGAKKGAIIGVIAGAVLGLIASSLSTPEHDALSPGAATLVGGAVGGAVLGLLGAGIGAATPKWHLKYEALPGGP